MCRDHQAGPTSSAQGTILRTRREKEPCPGSAAPPGLGLWGLPPTPILSQSTQRFWSSLCEKVSSLTAAEQVGRGLHFPGHRAGLTYSRQLRVSLLSGLGGGQAVLIPCSVFVLNHTCGYVLGAQRSDSHQAKLPSPAGGARRGLWAPQAWAWTPNHTQFL